MVSLSIHRGSLDVEAGRMERASVLHDMAGCDLTCSRVAWPSASASVRQRPPVRCHSLLVAFQTAVEVAVKEGEATIGQIRKTSRWASAVCCDNAKKFNCPRSAQRRRDGRGDG